MNDSKETGHFPNPREGGTSGEPLRPPPHDVMRHHPEEGTSLLEFLNVLLRYRSVILGLPLAAVSVALLVSFFLAPSYTASTTFVPEAPGGRVPGGLVGLASQFGLSIGAEANQSASFYADVLTSRELMQRVLLDRYPTPVGARSMGDSATLLAILDVGGRTETDRVQRGIRKLTKLVSTKVDNRTSMVRLSVEAGDADLAAFVANRFIHYLHEFNARSRQSQARERRKFAEMQILDAERGLQRAEQDLRGFYERNRSWRQSPQLEFEEGRLRRQVDVRQEVYLTLKREYEKARIEEVNDIPVITVVDSAVPINRRTKPRRLTLAVYALLLGTVAGTISAFAIHRADQLHREADRDYVQFRQLTAALRADLRRLIPGMSRGRDKSAGPTN